MSKAVKRYLEQKVGDSLTFNNVVYTCTGHDQLRDVVEPVMMNLLTNERLYGGIFAAHLFRSANPAISDKDLILTAGDTANPDAKDAADNISLAEAEDSKGVGVACIHPSVALAPEVHSPWFYRPSTTIFLNEFDQYRNQD